MEKKTMARIKSYNVQDVISAIDNYFNFVCRGNVNGLIMTKICKYLNTNGFSDINDRKLNRDEIVREYIEELKSSNIDEAYTEFVTYKPLDVDAFIVTNCTINKLKNALVILDNYYSNVCQLAISKIDESNNLIKDIADKQSEFEKLKANREELNKLVTEKNKRIKELSEACKKYKDYIGETMLPEVANEILRKEHIIFDGEPMISEQGLYHTTVNDNCSFDKVFDDIEKKENAFKNNVISGLFSSINEDEEK